MRARLPRRGITRVIKAAPGSSRAIRTARLARAVRRVLASGVFDRSWYELQRGRHFRNDRAAVQDYLQHGRGAGLSPHPLFEPEWADRAKWRSRRVDPLLHYLGKTRLRNWAQPHVLFDPGAGGVEPSRSGADPGPLSRFLAGVRPDSVLPLAHVFDRPAEVRWDRTVAHLREHCARWVEQERLRRAPRHVAHLDEDAQRAFRREFAHLGPTGGTPGQPLVTVVMPVWNRAAKVGRAVASVQAQTFGDWELVVVDDGSTDDTPHVLEGLAHFEPRLRVLRAEREGVSAARNRAIAAARGRYVAFLDSDNTWEPDFLRLVLAAMTRRDLPAAYSAMQLQHGDRTTYRGFSGGREYLLVGNHIDLNVLVVETALLREVGAFSTDLRRTVDYDLVLKLSERTELRYLPFIGAVYAEDAEDDTRISVREPLSWDYVVRSRHLVDWATAGAAPRVPGRISVVLCAHNCTPHVRRAVAALLAGAGEADLEIVVVDRASRRSQSLSLAALSLADARVRVVRTPVDVGFGLGVDLGLADSTGEIVLVGDPVTVVGQDWAQLVTESLADPGTAAVCLLTSGPDGTITAAGATFTAGGGLPTPFLKDLPVDDAVALGPSTEVPALYGPVWAARAADLLAVRGLDCLFVQSWHATDLSLRLVAARGGSVRLLTGCEVLWLPGEDGEEPRATRDDELFQERWSQGVPVTGAHLWQAAGFHLAHHRLERDDALGRRRAHPVLVRPAATVTSGPGVGLPRLRWALKTAVPAGEHRAAWEDWHFARSLAASLRGLGQDVAVDLREAAYRASGYLDDVTVVLRGPDQVDPDESQVTLLWVISHPDLVTAREVARFDRVFAASTSWARDAGERWGVPVQPLLRCTDPARFRPGAGEPDTGAPVLFVGNSRGTYRAALRQAVDAGVDLHVHGEGWEPFLPAEMIKSASLPDPDELPCAYASAGIVLDDRGDDVCEGFVPSRVFDVVATAGRLLSDEAVGVEDVCDGSVRTWHAPAELTELLREPPEKSFADREHRLAVAERIHREHSFDARARELLQAAISVREGR